MYKEHKGKSSTNSPRRPGGFPPTGPRQTAKTRRPRPPARFGGSPTLDRPSVPPAVPAHGKAADAPMGTPSPGRGHPRGRARSGPQGRYWLCGQHAVRAALANSARRIDRLLGTAEGLSALAANQGPMPEARPPAETVDRARIEALVPAGSVHQGVAALVAPLPTPGIDDMLFRLPAGTASVIVLDQVTDPRNVGAVLRAAAAFEASFVAVTERNAPDESAALAKAASGALDVVPLVKVVNLARAISALQEEGFVCVGLDSEATEPISRLDLGGRVAFVFGAEGHGLRRLTRERCDHLVRIPQGRTVESLNVASATAIALYERARQRSG